MNKHKIIVASMILLSLIVVGVEFVIKEKHGGLDSEQVLRVNEKTYSQGQWDGVNVALKYLQDTHQIDSIKLDIHVVDSMLTIKAKQ